MKDKENTNKIVISRETLENIALGVLCVGAVAVAAVSIKSYSDGYDDGLKVSKRMNLNTALKVIKENFRLGVLAGNMDDFIFGVNRLLEEEAEVTDTYYTKIRLVSN